MVIENSNGSGVDKRGVNNPEGWYRRGRELVKSIKDWKTGIHEVRVLKEDWIKGPVIKTERKRIAELKRKFDNYIKCKLFYLSNIYKLHYSKLFKSVKASVTSFILYFVRTVGSFKGGWGKITFGDDRLIYIMGIRRRIENFERFTIETSWFSRNTTENFFQKKSNYFRLNSWKIIHQEKRRINSLETNHITTILHLYTSTKRHNCNISLWNSSSEQERLSKTLKLYISVIDTYHSKEKAKIIKV